MIFWLKNITFLESKGICISMEDKTRLSNKGLSWEEFETRIDKIFEDIKQLIQDTNDTSDN